MIRCLLLSVACVAVLSGAGQADPATNTLLKEGFFSEETTVDQVKSEIAGGASVTETNVFAQNALYLALHDGAPADVVHFIASQGVSLNMPQGSRADPMALAAVAYGDIGLLEFFGENGTDFTVLNDVGEGALHVLATAERFDPKVLDFLLQQGGTGNDPALLSRMNDSIAMKVARSPADNWEELLDAYIALGADPAGLRSDGSDAFMLAAARNENLELVERFRQYSEDPFAKNNDGADALLMAARRITPEKLKYLVDLGFDVGATDAKGNTALITAARRGKADVLSLWLQQGLDANAANDIGITALMEAAQSNDAKAVQALLDGQADVNAVSDKGDTPLLVALSRRAPLFEGQEAVDKARDETAKIVDLLLASGADPLAIDSRGRTALLVALEADQPLLRIGQLLELGVDVNAKDVDGTSALMAAAMETSDPAVLAALLDAGADTSVRDVFDDGVAVLAADNQALAGSNVLTRLY